MITIHDTEITALYVFLRRREDELERELIPLLQRLENLLYQKLSIEELEKLNDSVSG